MMCSFHRCITKFYFIFLVPDFYKHCILFFCQIRAVAKKDGDSSGSDPSFRISDTPVVVFGSRAHLEEKALATVKRGLLYSLFYCSRVFASPWLNNLA
jgi:hypothetical protein